MPPSSATGITLCRRATSSGKRLDDVLVERVDARVGERYTTRGGDGGGELVAADRVLRQQLLPEAQQVAVGLLQAPVRVARRRAGPPRPGRARSPCTRRPTGRSDRWAARRARSPRGQSRVVPSRRAWACEGPSMIDPRNSVLSVDGWAERRAGRGSRCRGRHRRAVGAGRRRTSAVTSSRRTNCAGSRAMIARSTSSSRSSWMAVSTSSDWSWIAVSSSTMRSWVLSMSSPIDFWKRSISIRSSSASPRAPATLSFSSSIASTSTAPRRSLMSANARSTSSNLRSIGSDAIAEHDDRLVEADTHPADVGVDVGHSLADLFVDSCLGGVDAIVDPILGLVDALADDVRHVRLLARGLRGDLVEPGRQPAEAHLDVVDDLRRHRVHLRLGGEGDLVDVRDHQRRLVVELAEVLVERAEFLLEQLLAVLDLLDERTGRGLDGGDQADVRVVGDTADAGVHLLVASLVERGELGEAFFEGALDVDLERGRSRRWRARWRGRGRGSAPRAAIVRSGRRPSRRGGAGSRSTPGR